jgi:hypothetical protein
MFYSHNKNIMLFLSASLKNDAASIYPVSHAWWWEVRIKRQVVQNCLFIARLLISVDEAVSCAG